MEVSHPDRIVFPEDGITKGDVVDHYRLVAGRLLPFVSGRALTVQRFPKGIGGQGFMQKNAPDHYPEDLIRRHEVPKEGGGTTVYPVIDSEAAIVFFANLGVITFHAPPVTVEDVEHPDWVIWDLDPPDDGLDLVRQAALRMREALESVGIETLPMTSGSKGYHLRARLEPTVSGEGVARVARGMSALAAETHPDLMTLAFKKADRGRRVFVDWLRNHAYSTSVAPWSLRPRNGAPVATPLAWDEVVEIAPDEIRLGEVERRFGADVWDEMPLLDLTDQVGAIDELLSRAGIVLEPFDRFRS